MADKTKPTGGNGTVERTDNPIADIVIKPEHQDAIRQLATRRYQTGRGNHTDTWYNHRSRFGGRSDPVIISTFVRSRARLNREEAEVLYEFDWLAARICDQVANDSTREWISLKSEGDQKKAEKLREEDERLNGRGMFKEGITWGRLHGSALLVLGAFDGSDPIEALDLERIRKIMFTHVVDRWLAWPQEWYTDEEESMFGKVKVYRVHRLSLIGSPTAHVHESRVIRFDGNQLSPLARIRNWGWGASVLDKVYDQLRNWGISNQAASSVIPSFITVAMQIGNLQQLLANKDWETIRARLNEFAGQMSTNNLAFFGEGEKIEKIGTPITGLPELMDKFQDVVSGAADIPKSILFQAESGALGSTASKSDQQNWYNKIAAYQEVILRPKVRRWLDIIGVPLGIKPGEVDFEFNSLSKSTPEEEAALYYQIMQGDQLAIQTGMVDAPERLGLLRFGGKKFNSSLPVVDTKRMEKFLDELEKEPVVAHDPRAEEGQGLEQGAAALEAGKTGFDNEGKPEDKPDSIDPEDLYTTKLDKGQRNALAKKIKKLMAEGKSQDQAVAIAHNMLGLSKDNAEETEHTIDKNTPED